LVTQINKCITMTYDILEKSEQKYVPQLAVILYESDIDNEYYLESHDIDAQGRLKPGVPLSMECISAIAANFTQNHTISPHGAIPSNMLYADNRLGHNKYVWYNPPQKRMMYFSKGLNIPNAYYHIPGIIYVAKGNSLNLYAFKGKEPEAELFKAPFFNTTDGAVCLGSAKIDYPDNPSYQDIIDYWEKKFWLTEFSHLGGSRNPTKNNLVTVTKKSEEVFDYEELLPIGLTLEYLLK